MKSFKRFNALQKRRKAGKLTDAQIDMLLRCKWIDGEDADALKKTKAA